eukprot:Blabericola_migrator_1__13477@NODE_976_length_5843_cov_1203_626731_g676_i0_p6_GENE_NODE_976_length_5843_cov_1203_626731_g676_i0NODE_976_length_5843_cov_1203_626731_g676_i0_p6_ORF_typecomplete_len125_score1_39_NODE_976_length_5843_cov_1203_626731_g676_i015451919
MRLVIIRERESIRTLCKPVTADVIFWTTCGYLGGVLILLTCGALLNKDCRKMAEEICGCYSKACVCCSPEVTDDSWRIKRLSDHGIITEEPTTSLSSLPMITLGVTTDEGYLSIDSGEAMSPSV